MIEANDRRRILQSLSQRLEDELGREQEKDFRREASIAVRHSTLSSGCRCWGRLPPEPHRLTVQFALAVTAARACLTLSKPAHCRRALKAANANEPFQTVSQSAFAASDDVAAKGRTAPTKANTVSAASRFVRRTQRSQPKVRSCPAALGLHTGSRHHGADTTLSLNDAGFRTVLARGANSENARVRQHVRA